MVGIRHRSRHDIPGFVPAETVFVHEQSHHFGNTERGMRVVDMDRREIGKGMKVSIPPDMSVENIL